MSDLARVRKHERKGDLRDLAQQNSTDQAMSLIP